jgi:hypothetical protein
VEALAGSQAGEQQLSSGTWRISTIVPNSRVCSRIRTGNSPPILLSTFSGRSAVSVAVSASRCRTASNSGSLRLCCERVSSSAYIAV